MWSRHTHGWVCKEHEVGHSKRQGRSDRAVGQGRYGRGRAGRAGQVGRIGQVGQGGG